jgi:hypothetical protein
MGDPHTLTFTIRKAPRGKAAYELISTLLQVRTLPELMLFGLWFGACTEPRFDTPERRRICEGIGTMFTILSIEALGYEITGGEVSL